MSKKNKNKNKKNRKNLEKICCNCSLYRKKESVCGVNILKDGECFEITTKPQDPCIWEEMGMVVNQIRVWSDGKNGYVEYPADLYEEEQNNPDAPGDE